MPVLDALNRRGGALSASERHVELRWLPVRFEREEHRLPIGRPRRRRVRGAVVREGAHARCPWLSSTTTSA